MTAKKSSPSVHELHPKSWIKMSLTFGVFFMARYDEDFKIEVAKHYLSALIGARLLAAQYGLNHGTVRHRASPHAA